MYRESLVARRRALRLLPDSPQAKIAVVISLNGVARSLSHLGRLKEARTVFLEALELGEPLVRLHPLVDRYAHHVSFSHQGLGQLSQKENRFAEAERYFRQAVEARESIARRHPEVRTYVKDYFLAARGLRGLLKAQGKHSELLTVYRETAEMYEWYLARPDARLEFRTPRALLLHLWARFLLEQGQWEEGLDVAARAVRLLKDSLKESRETSPRVVVALKAIHEERARAFETLGRTAEAREERQQAARVPLAADGPNQQAAAGR